MKASQKSKGVQTFTVRHSAVAHRTQSSQKEKRLKTKSSSIQETAEHSDLAHAIYIKVDPLTGSKDAFSKCSKCGMVGSCRIQEEKPIQIEGVPYKLGLAKCFWMEHTFRILLSK